MQIDALQRIQDQATLDRTPMTRTPSAGLLQLGKWTCRRIVGVVHGYPAFPTSFARTTCVSVRRHTSQPKLAQ
jgi:hypothetical protein